MIRISCDVVGRPETRILVSPADSHYLGVVMRRRMGDMVEVLASDGQVWLGEWIGDGQVLLKQLAPPGWVPRRHVILYQALLKNDRFSEVVDRATQVGVSQIVPLVTDRCIVRDMTDNRLARWRAIAKEASEQCRRSNLLQVGELMTASRLSAQPQTESYVLAPLGIADRPWLHESVAPLELVVGPEGGLTPSEIEKLAQKGFRPLSLGEQIFRSENAGSFAALLFLQ